MTSNLACVGLAVRDGDELDELVRRVLPAAVELGRAGDVRVVRWQDVSGARLVLGVRRGSIVDLLPSFAGTCLTNLQQLALVNDDVAVAAVVDDDGEQLTSAALEVEQRRILPAAPGDVRASLVALGVEVEVFADPAAFAASDASLLSPEEKDSPVPAHYVDKGWAWPPRLAASSFISYGMFGDPGSATAHARLTGIVSSVESHEVAVTGQGFLSCNVNTAGFDVTVCLPTGSPIPAPGGVISGMVFMTASIHDAHQHSATSRGSLLSRMRRPRRG